MFLQPVTAIIKVQSHPLATTPKIPSLVMTKGSVHAWKTLLETSVTAVKTPTGMWAQDLAVRSVCAISWVLSMEAVISSLGNAHVNLE